MENILKEARANWSFGKRTHRILSFSPTPTPEQLMRCTEKVSVVGTVLVMSFSAAFIFICILELGADGTR